MLFFLLETVLCNTAVQRSHICKLSSQRCFLSVANHDLRSKGARLLGFYLSGRSGRVEHAATVNFFLESNCLIAESEADCSTHSVIPVADCTYCWIYIGSWEIELHDTVLVIC